MKFSIPFIVLRFEQPEKTLSAKDEHDDKSTSVKLVQLLKAPYPKRLHFERFILESFAQLLKAFSPTKVLFDKSMVVKLVQPENAFPWIELSKAVFSTDVKLWHPLKALPSIDVQLLKSILLRFVHPLNVLLFILFICFESFTSSSFEQSVNASSPKEVQLLMSIDFNDEQDWKAPYIIVVQLERSPTDCKLLQLVNACDSIVMHFFRLTDCRL